MAPTERPRMAEEGDAMSDHSQLKKAALRVVDIESSEGESISDAWEDFESAANPAAVLALIAEVDRLKTLRSTTERDLAQELEVWRNGPSCWNCGDTGDVHDIVGEWRGKCDCVAAQLIDVSSERDQLKAQVESLKQNRLSLDNFDLDAEWTALRKDAERYRWVEPVFAGLFGIASLDTHIDAAMGKGEKVAEGIADAEAGNLIDLDAVKAKWSDKRADRQLEAAARQIYESWSDQSGYVPWVEGGNSLKQDEARRLAMSKGKKA